MRGGDEITGFFIFFFFSSHSEAQGGSDCI